MKKLVLAMFVFVSCFTSKAYSDGHGIKMGIILGFTGPIESLAPVMAKSAELAIEEVNNSGNFMHGKIVGVRADSTCVDAAAAQAAGRAPAAPAREDPAGGARARGDGEARPDPHPPGLRGRGRDPPRGTGHHRVRPRPVGGRSQAGPGGRRKGFTRLFGVSGRQLREGRLKPHMGRSEAVTWREVDLPLNVQYNLGEGRLRQTRNQPSLFL